MQKKLIATALGAFGFGALVGWAVTADVLEKQKLNERKQYEEMIHYKTNHIWALQDRLDSLTESKSSFTQLSWDEGSAISSETIIPMKQGTLVATGTVIPKEDPNQIELMDLSELELVDVDEKGVPTGETVDETRTNLQKLIDQYVADPDAQSDFAELASKSVEYEDMPPFVISQGTYAWDEEGEDYEKISLTYYPRDRVLLDDEEDPIEDIANYVGWRNLTQFGGVSEDPDVVFVRNRRMKTDFEVIKEEEAQLPLHVTYGMEKEEFRVNRAAGLIRLRQEDDDN